MITKRRTITGVFFASFFAVGLTVPLLGVTIQDLAARFQVPIQSAGQFQTAMSVGTVVTSLFVGRLYDRLHARLLLPIGTGLLALSMAGYYFATNLFGGMISSVLLGVGFAILLLGPNVLITRLNPDNPAGSLNALNISYGVGAILTPQLVTLGALLHDVRLAYLFAAVILALMTIPVALVHMVPPQRTDQDSLKPMQTNIVSLLPFIVLFFCGMGIEVSFGSWIVTQAQTAAKAPLVMANFAASIFWIGYTLSRAVASWLSRYMQAGNLLISAIGVMIAGYGLMLAFPAYQTVLIASSFVIGVGAGPLFPTNMAITSKEFPRILGQVTGLLSAIGNIGPMTVPLIQGYIGGGRDGGMQLLLALSFVMLAAALALQRRMQREAIPVPG